MEADHGRPTGATATDPSSVPPARRPLRWDDPADARVWLDAVRAEVDDLVAAARDATRRPHKRVFSRVESRRRMKGAARSLADLLDAATRGLASEETGP